MTKNTKHALLERDSIWLLLPNKADIMTEKDLANLAFIQTQKIKLDERIDFNLNSLNESSSLFGLGWTYDFSTKGIWTDGNNSTILLNTENLFDDNYFIEIDVEPNLLRSNQLIKVKIFGTGITTQKISFDNLNDTKKTSYIKIGSFWDNNLLKFETKLEFEAIYQISDIVDNNDLSRIEILFEFFLPLTNHINLIAGYELEQYFNTDSGYSYFLSIGYKSPLNWTI